MPTYNPAPPRGGVPIRIAQPVTVQPGMPGGVRPAPAYQGAPPYGGSVYVSPPGGAAPQPSYPQPGYPQPSYPQPGYPQPGYPQPPPYGGGGYGYPDPYSGGYPYDPYGYGGYYPQMPAPYGYGYGYPSYYGGGLLGMLGGLLANGPHDELSPDEEYAIRQFYNAMRQRR